MKQQSGKRLSFNAGALVLGILWVIYRRMYLFAVLLLLGQAAFAYIEEVLIQQFYPAYDIHSTAHTVINGLLMGGLLAGFSNWLYLKHAERKIAQVLQLGLSEEETLMKLRKKGGTSLTFFVVVAAVVAIIITLAKLYPEAFSR